jgi:hypothetical protein
MDGKKLLLGEVKWTEGKTGNKLITQTYHALLKKETPDIKDISRYEIIHAVFFPEIRMTGKHIEGCYVVDAGDVLSSLL